ncbi:MAG: STAS domain-containing protein [Desulfuromonas thiophila]|jgi:ABC-type transporter Mla MlaB component|nr:STAS domain-containing protein [Desulfuromonas thiophila]
MFSYEERVLTTVGGVPQLELRLSGPLGIDSITELRDLLLRALQQYDRVTMDWAQVTAVDFAVLQLMCATNDYVQHHGKQFELRNRFIAPVIDVAQSLGFIRESGCPRAVDPTRCLWSPN